MEIIDNGCGIADLDSIVQFFSSSSSSSSSGISASSNSNEESKSSTYPLDLQSSNQDASSRNIGKSGRQVNKKGANKKRLKHTNREKSRCGVTYSFLPCSQHHPSVTLVRWLYVSIATKTLEHTFCSCLDILFDTHSASGQHRVQQQVLLEHSNFSSGTRVSLYMPLPPGSHTLSYGK